MFNDPSSFVVDKETSFGSGNCRLLPIYCLMYIRQVLGYLYSKRRVIWDHKWIDNFIDIRISTIKEWYEDNEEEDDETHLERQSRDSDE